MSLLISETFVNLDEGYRFGDSGKYEPFTDDLGQLYKSLRAEYGRCTGHVYIDTKEHRTKTVGWVFLKRMVYEDSRTNETYLREVWVTLLDAPDDVTVREHHHYMSV
jgi:hypothetical protein